MTLRKVVKQAIEGPLKGILGYIEDRLPPATLTVIRPLSPLMLGLALPSVTALSNTFPVMTMGLATAKGWWALWSIWLPRSKRSLDHQPQRKQDKEERSPQFLRSPCPNSIPQHTENIPSSTVSIPELLKKRERIREPDLLMYHQ